jgi:hypothetical protein
MGTIRTFYKYDLLSDYGISNLKGDIEDRRFFIIGMFSCLQFSARLSHQAFRTPSPGVSLAR